MRPWFAAAAAVAALAPCAAPAETLVEALTAAYVNNPDLQAARAAARSAREDFPQALAGYLPRVDAFGSYGTERTEDRPGLGVQRAEPYSYGLSVSQQLYTGGLRGAQIEQARAGIASARQSLRATEQDVLVSVIQAYVDVRRDEEVVRIRRSNLEVLERRLEESQSRFEVGDVTQTDVAQSRARRAGAQSDLTSALSVLEASRARYVQVIGRTPEALEAPPPAPPTPETLQAAIEAGLAANPDYLQLAELERSAKAQVDIERSDRRPQISIVGEVTREYDGRDSDYRADDASASAELTIPLFDGGYARARVRQARRELDRTRAQRESVRRQVVRDVIAAWNDYGAAQGVTASSREQVSANELALEGAREEFQAGLRTTLDVLNAQQELLDSRLAVVSAERDAYVAQHALLAAAGRLDGAALGVNAPLYDPDKHRR